MKKLMLISVFSAVIPTAFSQTPPAAQSGATASAPTAAAASGHTPFSKQAANAKLFIGPPSPTTALVLVDSANQTIGRTTYAGNNMHHVVIPYLGDYVTLEVWPDFNPAYNSKDPASKRYNSGGLAWKKNLELGNVALYTSSNCSGPPYISPSTYSGTTYQGIAVSDGGQTYLLVGKPGDAVTRSFNSYFYEARCFFGLLGNGELVAYPVLRFENVSNYGTPPFTIK